MHDSDCMANFWRQVWVSPVRPRVVEALLSFQRLSAVRLEAYSSLETARCFSALQHLPCLQHLDLRLSGSSFALDDNLEALASLASCSRLVGALPPVFGTLLSVSWPLYISVPRYGQSSIHWDHRLSSATLRFKFWFAAVRRASYWFLGKLGCSEAPCENLNEFDIRGISKHCLR